MRKRVTITLDADIEAWIKPEAKSTGKSLSEVIRTCLREYREIRPSRFSMSARSPSERTFFARDELTNLPRSVAFQKAVNEAVESFSASATAAVLILDIDNFKALNDTYGHAVGDQVIVLVAERIVSQVANKGVAARIGGEEFGILIPNLAESGAERIARDILDAVSLPFELASGVRLAVTASVGIAIGPRDGPDASLLLKNADLALYEAKQERNTLRTFQGLVRGAESAA